MADSVITVLVSPATAGIMPPWPGTGSTTDTYTYDWSMMMAMMLPVMMLGMVAPALTPREEKKKEIAAPAEEERKQLPLGRGD